MIIYVSVPVQLLEHVTSATKGSGRSLAAVSVCVGWDNFVIREGGWVALLGQLCPIGEPGVCLKEQSGPG